MFFFIIIFVSSFVKAVDCVRVERSLCDILVNHIRRMTAEEGSLTCGRLRNGCEFIVVDCCFM